MLHRLIAAGAALVLPAVAWAASEGMPLATQQPTGPVILTVSGNIQEFNSGKTMRFDRAMLEALGVSTLRTSTAWTAGVSVFEGVLARDLLEAVGADGTLVVATALNDFIISIPLQELRQYPVLLALKMDGKYLKVRDKGPIWIVYPRDQYPALRNSMVDKKWVWQLYTLEIR